MSDESGTCFAEFRGKASRLDHGTFGSWGRGLFCLPGFRVLDRLDVACFSWARGLGVGPGTHGRAVPEGYRRDTIVQWQEGSWRPSPSWALRCALGLIKRRQASCFLPAREPGLLLSTGALGQSESHFPTGFGSPFFG